MKEQVSPTSSSPLYLGVDTGGTFTDLVLMDDRGTIATAKAPTTPAALDQGVLAAIELVANERQETVESLLGRVVSFGHGTTQATNALIERCGARTGLITTAGFGDTLFIQRLMGFTAGIPTSQLGWYSRRRPPQPIVPRTLVREVPERVDHSGATLSPLDDDAARTAVRELVEAGIQAIAVCLLWSFRNPAHEQRIAQIIREEAGDGVFVTLSSDIAPVIGEYERTATTVLNSYLGPTVARYLERLEEKLCERGFAGVFSVLTSIGGVLTAREAARRAVLLLTSGPTGGLIGSRYLAEALAHRNVITTDMGGTSFDVGLIIDGRPVVSAVSEVAKYHIASPVIDITAVGSGGGSIATVQNGLIRVGPESAGAEPGPVCYGRGGTLPTVTDADLVLGYLDPDGFLDGRMPLDRSAAAAAIDEHVATPLGLPVLEAAAGIRRIVDAQMADTLRELTIGQGHDPRDFTLYAYGGAGPLHCAGYGADLGVAQIVVPATSMVQSAYGALASDVQVSADRSILVRGAVDPDRLDVINSGLVDLEARCLDALKANGAEQDADIHRRVDMRFRRQTHELLIDLEEERLDAPAVLALMDRFERTYEDTYGPDSAFRDAGIEITTLRVDAVGRTRKPRLAHRAQSGRDTRTMRAIYDMSTGRMRNAEIIQWTGLPDGAVIEGPAVVAHPTTTVLVAAGQTARVDPYGNLIIDTGRAA